MLSFLLIIIISFLFSTQMKMCVLALGKMENQVERVPKSKKGEKPFLDSEICMNMKAEQKLIIY